MLEHLPRTGGSKREAPQNLGKQCGNVSWLALDLLSGWAVPVKEKQLL